ncbi:hypothetical protein [uncultured Legionella sp.]|uniref:hypothetical protein n=1 Tax=uncultured Legionella sp. TaxID=210934 RepID=UPI00263841AD|nr:hypothetical protein [uncultured Legionella sp.]
MVNKFFFEQTDKQVLINIKELLKQLKQNMNDITPDDAIKILISLLKVVFTVVKKNSLSSDCQIASWLLLADVYASLSYTHSLKSSKSQKNTDAALIEAFNCVDKVRTIMKCLPMGYKLDGEFIKQCNTFAVANVDEAINCIKTGLIMPLIEQVEEQPLYSGLGQK